MTDKIISMHNFIDYNAVGQLYKGGIETAVKVISANSGSEHDIPEDYEDYKAYPKMMKLAVELGINLRSCNFETLQPEDKAILAERFSYAGFPAKQIRKFLHMARGTQLTENQHYK